MSIIQFTATWCEPCKMVKPVIEQLKNEYIFEHVLIDVDEDEENQASKYNIKSLPTVIFLINDNIVEKIEGANLDEIRKKTDQFFTKKNKNQIEIPRIKKAEIANDRFRRSS